MKKPRRLACGRHFMGHPPQAIHYRPDSVRISSAKSCAAHQCWRSYHLRRQNVKQILTFL
jgi:hypothetical protein